MAKSKFTKLKITALSVVIPDYPRNIEEDMAEFGGDPAKLARAKKIVGYGTRYAAPPGCTPTDLAQAAAERLIADTRLETGRLDALICVMQKPDYPQPGSSFILHKNLGLPKTCACLDLNQGCPGFVYGLWLAGGLLESGACRAALIVTADHSPSDDSAPRGRLLFGDAGAAALVERSDDAAPSFFNLGADGGCYEAIVIPAGGDRLPIDRDVLDLSVPDRQGGEIKLTDGYLDGLEVFNFSVRETPPSLLELFAYAGVKPADIDFAAFHQANKQIVDSIAAKAGLGPNQYSTETFSAYGNQSSASVPGVLAHMLAGRAAAGRLKVLLCGYGIGAAWASCLTELEHIHCPGPVKMKFENLKTREELIAHWVKRIGEGRN